MNAVVSISVFAGLITYAGFFLFAVIYWLRGVTGRALLLASALTLMWLTSLLFTNTQRYYLLLEPIVIAAWIVLLVRALGISFTRLQISELRPVIWTFSAAMIMAATASAIVGLTIWIDVRTGLSLSFHLVILVVYVLGLVLLEQLVQNVVSDLRWRIRYLNIGLGMMFVFGLVHHALAILLQGPLIVLSSLQPAVMALMVPFIIIASLRNRTNQLRFSLSRDFVFRTGVLVSTGTFLLLLGLLGYLAQIFAGNTGLTVAVFLGIIGISAVLIVSGSSRFRSRIRVLVSKTFFEYRYDYRDEWMKVTAQLTEPDPDFDFLQQSQRAMLAILHAKNSCLWSCTSEGLLVPISHLAAADWMQPMPPRLNAAIKEFYSTHDWVLDLKNTPQVASEIGQHLPSLAMENSPSYMIPLFVENKLFGICLVGPSEIPMSLSWEDYDIIKLISKQCAGFLALQDANQRIMEQEQLSAVHQISAFLIHDLKTIAAQLSLMLENAPRHRDKPAFIDDMLKTTSNSVQRMHKIITSLRQPQESALGTESDVDLRELLVQRQQGQSVVNQHLSYSYEADPIVAHVDLEALVSALTHLEQNALEAIDESGTVQVNLSKNSDWALLSIADDGVGMSENFIKTNLFAPFHSSKGLAGMGIGAYQARKNIHNCGGDLQVDSKVGVGTTFTIKLPLAVVEQEA